MDRFLTNGNLGGTRWNGPYLQAVGEDPWGHAYLVNVHGFFNPGERAMILSCGPDGILNTSPRSATPAEDDLILLID